MINTKSAVMDNIDEIKKILKNEKLQIYFVNLFYKGMNNFNKAQELEEGISINSYTNSKGIERTRKIGNAICNDENGNDFGIKADVILGCKIPIIRIGNIAITIKSLKNSKDILKSSTGYIKEFSKINDKINLQTNMFEDSYVNLNAKYYCTLTYNFSHANTLTYMEFVFLDEKASSILFTVEIPESILKPQRKITHKDPYTRAKKDIKDNSFKNILKIKKL